MLGRRFLGDGHRTFGPVTIYALDTAMHGAVNIATPWGYLCIKPPTFAFGCWWRGYFYLSPDATPTHPRARGWRRGL